LKQGGKLILTAPNISHYRAKLSYFFAETEFYKRSSPNELDSIWFSGTNKDEVYFGHIFLINAQKLRTLSKLSGFKIERFVKTDLGISSLILFPIFYVFTLLFNFVPFIKYRKKLKHIDSKIVKIMMKEQFLINCSPKLLLCKHMLVVLSKEFDKKQNIEYLKSLTRKA
jgi:hypothetical protein